MAMYYYARRLAKAGHKKQQQQQPPTKPQNAAAAVGNVSNHGNNGDKVAKAEGSQVNVEVETSPHLTNSPINHQLQISPTTGLITSGSLEALIDHLLGHVNDVQFVFPFLLSSRLFLPPHSLLSSLMTKCRDPLILTSLLSTWTSSFPYDFREARMNANVRKIAEGCVKVCPQLQPQVGELLAKLLEKLEALEMFEKRSWQSCSQIPFIPPEPKLIAEQLTAIEASRLGIIGAQEFVQAFMKQDNCHVNSYVNWFHRLSELVSLDSSNSHKKGHFWSSVAAECLLLGNYNSSMAIFTGLRPLNLGANGNCERLATVFDPVDDFRNYRNIPKESIRIPFFSLLIKDLFFLKQAVEAKTPSGHLNFSAMLSLGARVRDVVALQNSPLPPNLRRDEAIIGLFSSLCFQGNTVSKFPFQVPVPVPVTSSSLTDSFQSLPLPSNSSSTSGVHEESESFPSPVLFSFVP